MKKMILAAIAAISLASAVAPAAFAQSTVGGESAATRAQQISQEGGNG
jgi:hypothetical protein